MQTPRHVAMYSLHTSPLAQAGSGDAGGLNVYVLQLARALAASGVQVDIYTQGGHPGASPAPGITVRHVGPAKRLRKEELPEALPGIVAELAEAGSRGAELIHTHYWVSGMAGLSVADAWDVPLVHSMHTTARSKERHRATGQAPEHSARADGEAQIVRQASRLLVNTRFEAEELVQDYDAAPARLDVVPPGVDTQVFHPEGPALRWDEPVVVSSGSVPALELVFAGRLQALKGPHILLGAMALLRTSRPDLSLRLTVIGARSGPRSYDVEALAREFGLTSQLRLVPPAPPEELAQWFRGADVVAMPSSSETFGLVALEAQACGTPVLATRIGGLVEAVRDGESGLLVDGRAERDWAAAIASLADDPARLARWGLAGIVHARRYSWQNTATLALDSYRQALNRHHRRVSR
ncbi:glycosyltransferase [Psychromicrobium xiongbiense]|uniref:glycosyltransferase n=1 Tax=Psychromicrobium xiongbiense TaxID=3051184 RepID=UPI0025552996|nr:glycosyltransferase [Psychromicrobium sp. YIM S02556]